MYTTTYCPLCAAAKSLLNSKKVNFEQINVDGDAKKRKWLQEQTGKMTVPQIFVDNKPAGGYQELVALDQEGKLDELLIG